MIKAFQLFTLLFLLGGCTVRHGTYSVLSSRPMSLYTLAADNEIVAKNVSSAQTRYCFLVFPFDPSPKIDNAVETLLRQYQGDYLSNAEISHSKFSFLGLWSRESWKIGGNVVRIAK